MQCVPQDSSIRYAPQVSRNVELSTYDCFATVQYMPRGPNNDEESICCFDGGFKTRSKRWVADLVRPSQIRWFKANEILEWQGQSPFTSRTPLTQLVMYTLTVGAWMGFASVHKLMAERTEKPLTIPVFICSLAKARNCQQILTLSMSLIPYTGYMTMPCFEKDMCSCDR